MKIPTFPTPCEVSPEEQEHWRKHFAGIEAEKWDHQTWDTVIVDPALILKHLERASSEPHPSPWLSQPESDFVLGPGPTPRGLRYSMVVLLNLRDEGKVTSWLPVGPQGPAKNTIYFTTTEWWFGECEWDLGGRGILNGEPITRRESC